VVDKSDTVCTIKSWLVQIKIKENAASGAGRAGAMADTGREHLLGQLEQAAAQAGIEVRYQNLGDEDVNVGSGLCYLRRKPLLIVDSRLGSEARIAILVRELKSMDLDSVYLKPAVRELLENAGS